MAATDTRALSRRRRQVKYENQLREKPKLDAAAAKGTLNDEEMGALAWYTAETPEKLQVRRGAARRMRSTARRRGGRAG